MNEGMDNEQIERVFSALGRIEQSTVDIKLWMANHALEDKQMAADIVTIKTVHARQRGFMAAIGVVGGVLGALIAAAANLFGSRGST